MSRITIVITICVAILEFHSCSFSPNQNRASSLTQVFEFNNDTINQIMEITKINKDTLKISLKTINKFRKTSCKLEGTAIHDTVGDFLNEEETEEIENNEVMQVKDFTFFYKGSIPLLKIALDIKSDRLRFYGIDSAYSSNLTCNLFNSIGTLKKRS
jgi:hypothetical protein